MDDNTVLNRIHGLVDEEHKLRQQLGKGEISSDEEETALVQRLTWWHGEGKQTLKVTGVVRNHGMGVSGAEDAGYYEQCNQGASNCAVM